MLSPTPKNGTGHGLRHIFTKWTPPDKVKSISVKQKLEKPNKLTLKQFNREMSTTSMTNDQWSLVTSFPSHDHKG